MPSHCENDLYIDGPAEDVEKLLEFMGVNETPPEFDFGKIIPYPEEYEKKDKEREELGYKGFAEKYGPKAQDGFNSGGYEWCINHWGTKWGAYQVEKIKGGITFQTAWSPPNPNVIGGLHELFPKCSLHLEYFESGSGFCGGYSFVCEDEFYPDEDGEEWKSGVVRNEWEGIYHGRRGG